MILYIAVCYFVMMGIYFVDKDERYTFKDYFLWVLIAVFAPIVVPVVVGMVIGRYIENDLKKYSGLK